MIVARFTRLSAVGGLVLFAADVSGQSIDDAESAFTDGRFVEAADIAEAVGTSTGYALAAKSLAIYGHYVATEEGDRDEAIARAIRMGEEAVRADSTNAEAYFQSAHAVGRYAQTVGTMTALRKGLGGKVRDLLEAALAINPDFAEAHLALAGWHADVAAAGRVARWMYGGNREDAITHFKRAMELEPEHKVVLFEYGVRLPDLDEEAGVARAREMLSRALDLPVRDAYEDYVHLAVLDGLDALKDG